MATFRAQVAFPFFSNLPSDVWTNTLHFTELAPLGLAGASALITPLLSDFYETIYAVARPMANYCQPGSATVNWYDLTEPEPRVPIILPLAATITVAASKVPTEVSIVASFQGDRSPGIPQARRRGRIYLGGCGDNMVETSAVNAYPRLTTGVQNAVATACENLITALSGSGMRWSVWSPTDQAATIITNGWVDNMFDTQRRRSVNTEFRTLWP